MNHRMKVLLAKRLIYKVLLEKAKERSHNKLLELVKSQFKLDLAGHHGISHWDRVAEIGQFLSEYTGADKEVVRLFAYLHDSKRENESNDQEHGPRASIFVQELYDQGHLNISPDQLKRLIFACKYHTDADVKSDNITVQTCWDADRLDLGRVGIIPRKEFLNTDFAKQDEVIEEYR